LGGVCPRGRVLSDNALHSVVWTSTRDTARSHHAIRSLESHWTALKADSVSYHSGDSDVARLVLSASIRKRGWTRAVVGLSVR
jgi:hypothetical protein